MPPAQVGPEALRVLGAALGSLGECARSGADEVLSHFPDAGDRELQSVLDDHLDQVADLLREVDSCATEVGARLRLSTAADAPARGPALRDARSIPADEQSAPGPSARVRNSR
ncbi:hypothetical protein ABEG17_02790 [Pedococcus sp. KACC 23699]|uniref:Uncharacterized protein n=1 Tax=Pedococcus sp. KACC 23699 TaxID=3149228 RepID=A0AAU7JVQ0_9MICO